ncbi:MAG: hypothetical protein IKX60_05065 [Bacteroidales bacterium]|nr:hypothetical protein [Bacteroidales bacterium]
MDNVEKKTAAAQELVGKELIDGWVVTGKKTKKDTDTGSFFSVCYVAGESALN